MKRIHITLILIFIMVVVCSFCTVPAYATNDVDEPVEMPTEPIANEVYDASWVVILVASAPAIVCAVSAASDTKFEAEA